MQIKTIKHILKDNDRVAAQIRERLKAAGTLGLNLISSPGSGKTTLLEKTLPWLQEQSSRSMVIVGDLETARDAQRLDGCAVQSIQINTGLSCHLYANQIAGALEEVDLAGIDYLFIENVGNLVCPGEFDLGENLKVVLYSFPEGDDKVAKYPTVFRVADIILLTKFDLESVCGFDRDRVMTDIRKLNTHAPVLDISTRTGYHMQEWFDWLTGQKTTHIGRQARFVKE